jgi:hypothetical protein
MFSRIRYAAHVLSSPTISVPLTDRPDIVFEDVKPQEVTAASKRIAKAFEVLLISIPAGMVSVTLYERFSQAHLSVTGLAAAVASIATFFLSQWYDRINAKIGERLKISERIAPYVGHRLARAIRILRG